jgi:hypothetical protein
VCLFSSRSERAVQLRDNCLGLIGDDNQFDTELFDARQPNIDVRDDPAFFPGLRTALIRF